MCCISAPEVILGNYTSTVRFQQIIRNVLQEELIKDSVNNSRGSEFPITKGIPTQAALGKKLSEGLRYSMVGIKTR